MKSPPVPCRSLLLSLLLFLPLALAGCGGKKLAGPFKVALLTTGPVTDGGWDQAAYAGLQQIHADLGAQVDKRENLTPGQFAGALQDFAGQGYTVVFADDDAFGPAAAQAAAQFPHTVFVITGGAEKPGPNVAPLVFATEEATYLQGMEAAMVSKSGQGGFIGGQDEPEVTRAAGAFAAGARAVNPKFQVVPISLGSWDDAGAAKTATDTLLSSGVDVVAHDCRAAAAGMFQAAAGKSGVYTFGTDADENEKASNVLSSAVVDVPKALDDVARSVKDGTFTGQSIVLGLKAGDVRLIDNPKLTNSIPASGKAKIQDAARRIADGSLKVTGA